MAKLFIRFQLEGELIRIYKIIKKAYSHEPLQPLSDDGVRCFGNTIEIPISEEDYQQIWNLMKESASGYASVEEFVQEVFTDILRLAWKVFAHELQERTLAYLI